MTIHILTAQMCVYCYMLHTLIQNCTFCIKVHTEKALISILIATISLLLKSPLTVNVSIPKNTIQNCNTIQNSHVARNFKEEPEFYTGTFLGKVHSADPHHIVIDNK